MDGWIDGQSDRVTSELVWLVEPIELSRDSTCVVHSSMLQLTLRFGLLWIGLDALSSMPIASIHHHHRRVERSASFTTKLLTRDG